MLTISRSFAGLAPLVEIGARSSVVNDSENSACVYRSVSWEADLDLFIIDATDYHTSRIMQRFICDSFHNGSIGHRLYRHFLDFGFVDVQSTPLVRNFADFPLIENAFDLTASVERAIKQRLLEVDQAMLCLDSLRSANHSGQFISAIGGFITFGRKA